VTVLHLTRDFPPAANGGISSAVGGVVERWPDCAVLSFEDWRPKKTGLMDLPPPVPEVAAGAPVLRLQGPGQLAFARRWAVEQAPHVLVVHDGFLWGFAEELRAERGWPVVVAVHVDHAALNRARGVTEETTSLRLQRAALAGADAVVAPSSVVAAELRDRTGRDVAVAGFGAERIADAGPPCSVLYAGRFDSAKGTDVFFAALPRLLDTLRDATVCVAGGLPASPKLERKWLERQGRALAPWADRVELAGWLSPRALAARYAGASLVVVPSRAETFGLVALEAMAHGAAVLGTDLPALRELLGDEACLPVGDAGALTRGVVARLRDPARLQRMAARNEMVARRWSWSRSIEAWQAAVEGA
jgi:glycosyltransferase involved in cell wall biosynthesis